MNEKKSKEKKMPSLDFGIGGFLNRLRPTKPEKAKQEGKQKAGEKKKEEQAVD